MMYSLTATVAILSILCCITPVALGFFFDIFPYPFVESIIARDDAWYKTIGPSPTERVRKHGYTAETHIVVTKDGYILQMHRITGTKDNPKPDNKPIVLLMHGLLDCSSTWVLGSTERSLGYLFANRGYDVWMGNVRGNRYGRNHTYYSTQEKRFWMFSIIVRLTKEGSWKAGSGRQCERGWPNACSAFGHDVLKLDSPDDTPPRPGPATQVSYFLNPTIPMTFPMVLSSWHEMGIYDIPALIDHILMVTKQEKLIYVGHSQGGTAFFVMASMRPEYREKIDIMVALAPAVFVGHLTIPVFQILTSIADETREVADTIGLYEFIPTPLFLQNVGKHFCGDNFLTQPFCDTDIAVILAPGEKLMNKTLVSEALEYDPAGASVKEFLHYTQLISSGKFQQYDYGMWNMMEYASMDPPEYPIQDIDVPIFIFYGNNDEFVVPKDVEILASKLPNARKYLVPDPSFSHVDFVWSDDAGTLVYEQLLNHIADHLNQE